MVKSEPKGTVALWAVPSKPALPPLDWPATATAFDKFVMDPANGVRFTDAGGHPVFTAALEGSTGPNAKHELVSFGPITLGRSLLGCDVGELLPSLSAYFDTGFGVFLNRPGHAKIEMWYLMYAVSLATHLIQRHLRTDAASVGMLRNTFDHLVSLAHLVDYDFNHQGFDFSTGKTWTRKEIYRQADALGGYGYLMLMASQMFGDRRYFDEARRAIRKYIALPSNPWYEAPDLAMGVAAAAFLQAAGEDIDARRALEFVLDPEAGMVVGSWGGKEVNCLYRGWRHSTPESAYSMESLVILPYMLPAVRYRPDLAPSIGKYALHVAANTRWFYSNYLDGAESRGDLSPVVTYERLYENFEGRPLYAAGDFEGHKSIYGGAYALFWGALVKPTEDAFILQIDCAATNFFDPEALPVFLYFNPHAEDRSVTLDAGNRRAAVEDLVTGRTISDAVSGKVKIEVPAGDVRLVELVPEGRKSRRAPGV